MSDTTNPGQTINEFGSKVDAAATDTGLNEQGKVTTLDDILAAVRGGKVVEKAPDPVADAAAAAAADDKTDPVKDATGEFNTGNKALDIAVSTFARSTGASDTDFQRACQNALDYNDPALIDKAFLTERFKDRAEDALALAQAVIEQAGIEKQRLVESVYSLAGDEAKWKESLSVYKQHAPAGLQKALSMMFNSGDAASVKEAAQLVVDFAKGSGVVPAATGRFTAGAGFADSAGLSATEFQAAVGKLNQSSRTYNADYNKLIEMRRIGKQLNK
jgi:hypothetical protein